MNAKVLASYNALHHSLERGSIGHQALNRLVQLHFDDTNQLRTVPDDKFPHIRTEVDGILHRFHRMLGGVQHARVVFDELQGLFRYVNGQKARTAHNSVSSSEALKLVDPL